MRYQLIKDPKVRTHLRDSAYELWHDVWFDTLQKLDGINHLNSDPFLNADAITTIEDKDKVIALQMMNFHSLDSVNLNKAAIYMYDDQAWQTLRAQGVRQFMTYEWMCVHPDYRRGNGKKLAVVLQWLSCGFQIRNKVDVALTLTNNSRSVQKTCMAVGAEKILPDGVCHNVDVSYLVFHRENLQPPEDHEAKQLISQILNDGQQIEVA